MRCPIQTRENSELLLAYCDRKLQPDVAAALERHIGTCPSCQQALAGQQLVWQALDAWEAVEISPDFNRRLYQRIEGEGSRSGWARLARPLLGRPTTWRPAMAVASAATVLLAVTLMRTPETPAQERAGGIDSDIEKVERTLEDLEMLRELSALKADDPRPAM
ncbi:MAG: zf-HC2 domain-containing protein [Bryobacteraceae bacterium]